MVNKNYWDKFYEQNQVPEIESSFAHFVLEYIKENGISCSKLIDVACGNGRDTFFFARNGISSMGIDQSVTPKSDTPKFVSGNIINYDYSMFDIIYMRFIVHALTEAELDLLFEQIMATSNGATIFIETRSSKLITDEAKTVTYFNSGIGREHFRMLYSEEYLTSKLKSNFEILFVSEDSGFSVFRGEDPICIRYVLQKKRTIRNG